MEIDYKQWEQDLINAGESPERTESEIMALAISNMAKKNIIFGYVSNDSFETNWIDEGSRSIMLKLNFEAQLPYNMACYKIKNPGEPEIRMTIKLDNSYPADTGKTDAYCESILQIFNKHCKVNA